MVRVKVRESCNGYWFDFGIYKGKKMLMRNCRSWHTPKFAIRNAKALAKLIRVKYDPEIIKQHGC